MYPMVHQGKLVVLRGTPSKPVVTVVQQLVLKNGYNMVAIPSRSKKKEGVQRFAGRLSEASRQGAACGFTM